jgi:hypothetical protein
MARCARQCVTLLEALTLAKILHLIGDVILLGVSAHGRAEKVIQNGAGAEAEWRGATLVGIAVTLGANFNLTIAWQLAWACHRCRRHGCGMALVEGHVVAPGPMAALARHPQDEALRLVLVTSTGRVVKPSIVALQAARRCLTSEVA